MKQFLFNKFRTQIIILGIISINCGNIEKDKDDIQEVEDFPFKSYELNDEGIIIHSEMDVSDFQLSADCAECHPDHYEEWTRSPHANSINHKFFNKCLNETEEEFGVNFGKFCHQCHNPISIIANMDTEDSEIQHGVSCDVCHTMTKVSSPTIATPYEIVTSKLFLNPGAGIKYGAMENPTPNTYHDSQFNPIFNQSQLCLPCHDLRNENLETEITFTEWNRILGMAMSGAFPCQQCHMPEKDDGTHEHHFAGVDLSYEVPPEEDAQYNDVLKLISQAAIISFESNNMELLDSLNWQNNISIPVKIESLNGHHLPSGTSFNRECWVAIEVRNENEKGELIYQNGVLENNIQLLNYYDSNLTFFTSFLIDEDGDTTQDVLKAEDIINYSLPGMSVKYSNYEFELSQNISSIWIKAKLLFRPIKPFIFNDLPELKPNIPIYTIDEIEKTVQIVF